VNRIDSLYDNVGVAILDSLLLFPGPAEFYTRKTAFRIECAGFASDKRMRNDAKRSEKDAKTNSKQARGSETKQNKVRLL
jgi:hypothetical protein